MADSKRRPPSRASRPKLHVVEDAHSHQEPKQEAHQNGVPHSAVGRAEDLVDRWGGRLAALTRVVAHSALRAGSRVKEEVEDLWAEAQAVSRSKD